EDEIAQSEAANGCKFVNYWLHCAHLMVEGQKMSKSLGNFFTLRDILDKGYTGREIRWVLIGAHYRQSLNFSMKALDDARTSLQRIDTTIARIKEMANGEDKGLEQTKAILDKAEKQFADGLADDLNISEALAAIFDMTRELNKLMDNGELGGDAAKLALATFDKMDTVMAVFTPDKEDGIPQEIIDLANERQAARKAKNFARADEIRGILDAKGWLIEDTPNGPRPKRK
ncbi:MAG: cysteine--tRNA ligase, partial [Victivallales bacterium]|nr:cysteine--tRNA ligase [Victivallales bacterium]